MKLSLLYAYFYVFLYIPTVSHILKSNLLMYSLDFSVNLNIVHNSDVNLEHKWIDLIFLSNNILVISFDGTIFSFWGSSILSLS